MGKSAPEKSVGAYRTISEVAADLALPQHVLRFWETRFSQIRPLKRAGGRRFYRPADVVLLRDIRAKLYDEGYTIKGVQRLLRERGATGGTVDNPAEGQPRRDGAAALINGNPEEEVAAMPRAEADAAAPAPPAAPGGTGAPSPRETLTESGEDALDGAADLLSLREALAAVESCERRLRAVLALAP